MGGGAFWDIISYHMFLSVRSDRPVRACLRAREKMIRVLPFFLFFFLFWIRIGVDTLLLLRRFV